MQPGRAGSHDHSIEFVFSNRLYDYVLTGFGAYVFIISGKNYSREIARFPHYPWNIDNSSDVGTAPAHKEANPSHYNIAPIRIN
jgi:hypothetical protein